MSTAKWREQNEEKVKGYKRKYYDNNIERYKRKSKSDNENRSLWIRSVKDGKSCKYCGESFWACLDFHHRPGTVKEFSLSYGIKTRSKRKVEEEIRKCDVVCANCHRKIHNGNLIERFDSSPIER